MRVLVANELLREALTHRMVNLMEEAHKESKSLTDSWDKDTLDKLSKVRCVADVAGGCGRISCELFTWSPGRQFCSKRCPDSHPAPWKPFPEALKAPTCRKACALSRF